MYSWYFDIAVTASYAQSSVARLEPLLKELQASASQLCEVGQHDCVVRVSARCKGLPAARGAGVAVEKACEAALLDVRPLVFQIEAGNPGEAVVIERTAFHAELARQAGVCLLPASSATQAPAAAKPKLTIVRSDPSAA